jgi:DNA ligase-1
MRVVSVNDVRGWLAQKDDLGELTGGMGARDPTGWLDEVLGLPVHLHAAMRHLLTAEADAAAEGAPPAPASMARLASIPFVSLCRGLLLPLSGLSQEKAAWVLRIQAPPPPNTAEREALIRDFLRRDSAQLGLDPFTRLCCVLGDPFGGRAAGIQRDSLITLLQSLQMRTRREMLDQLARVGDVSVLFAEHAGVAHREPRLTAAEVLFALRALPDLGRTDKLAVLRSLLERCGRVEAWCLARLVQKKAGFGMEVQGPVLARALADVFQADPEQVAHAMALSDPFRVAHLLATEGAAGLREVQLQPLVPFRPALAGGKASENRSYPTWVERKYDGIRLLLHKSTDAHGTVLVAAYTRNRQDWLELARGLAASVRALPVRNCIIDGELHGTIIRADGPRPAGVYEVYKALQGEATRAVQLRFAAFDLLYLDGHDLTARPLVDRRGRLAAVVGPTSMFPLPVPIDVSLGQQAANHEEVNRLYEHFRAQGYEGVILKDPRSPYRLGQRDPTWMKRKPEVTLDLVIIGAVFAVTEKRTAGMFGSYVIAARDRNGEMVDIGDVAGLDVERDRELQHVIAREGLITGRRVTRQSASGERSGIELRPYLVVSVRFEDVLKDTTTGELKLRGPKIVAVRSDKGPDEADTIGTLESLYVGERLR